MTKAHTEEITLERVDRALAFIAWRVTERPEIAPIFRALERHREKMVEEQDVLRRAQAIVTRSRSREVQA